MSKGLLHIEDKLGETERLLLGLYVLILRGADCGDLGKSLDEEAEKEHLVASLILRAAKRIRKVKLLASKLKSSG